MSPSGGRRPVITPALRLVFAAVLGVIVGTALVSYRNTREMARSSRGVVRTHEALAQVSGLLSAVQAVETSARGYVLTGDRTSLEPYFAARASLRPRLARLAHLTADNPRQQRLLAQLRTRVQTRLALLRRAIRLVKAGRREAARIAAAGEADRRAMDAVRATAARMQRVERTLLQQRVRTAAAMTRIATVTFTVAAALAGLLVAPCTTCSRASWPPGTVRISSARGCSRASRRRARSPRSPPRPRDRARSAIARSWRRPRRWCGRATRRAPSSSPRRRGKPTPGSPGRSIAAGAGSRASTPTTASASRRR